MGLMILAAYAGTQTGYLIGRTAGPKVFAKEDSRFFKQKYIDQTYAYFDRYGGRTLIVAQFIPFVRTYASVAAGVGKMKYRHFARLEPDRRGALGRRRDAPGLPAGQHQLHREQHRGAAHPRGVLLGAADPRRGVAQASSGQEGPRASPRPATSGTTSRRSATTSRRRPSTHDAPRPARDPLLALGHGRRARARGHRDPGGGGVRPRAARRRAPVPRADQQLDLHAAGPARAARRLRDRPARGRHLDLGAGHRAVPHRPDARRLRVRDRRVRADHRAVRGGLHAHRRPSPTSWCSARRAPTRSRRSRRPSG